MVDKLERLIAKQEQWLGYVPGQLSSTIAERRIHQAGQ